MVSGAEPKVEPGAIAAVKRTIPIKEPPPFKWKLIGYVEGLTVTLLKAIELPDAEAQLVRLAEEGYYRGLQIFPIDAKVPNDPQAARHSKERKAKELVVSKEKARKEAAKKPAAKAPVSKPVTIKSVKKTEVKPVVKPKAAAKKPSKKK